MAMTPDKLKHWINTWPTFVGQGIEVLEVGDDWTHALVRLNSTEVNANYLGTAFGGSLFSMLDPFFVILALEQLGPDFNVWDKAAAIEFVRPGTSAVTARIDMPADIVEEMRAATKDGEKLLRWFEVDPTDEAGEVVARARRQLYVRKKRDRSLPNVIPPVRYKPLCFKPRWG